MTRTCRPATLSLDLDNMWAYMRVHGDRGWEQFPSFFEIAVPRMLDALRQRDLRITVFVVGQDAVRDENKGVLSDISRAGHDIGNHSFHHRPSFAFGTEDEIDREIAAAEDAIELATGVHPIGFRGPGFSLSSNVLRVLKRRGYRYDASTFPTFLGPIARTYYKATVRDGTNGSEERENLYGGWADVFRPLKPYCWRLPDGNLVEIPVTTVPFVRTPFHMTYLLYLWERSPRAARTYLRCALRMCRSSRTAPSMLLHALDFVGGDDAPELTFFPGMALSGAKKVDIVAELLDELCSGFSVQTLQQYTVELDDDALESRIF